MPAVRPSSRIAPAAVAAAVLALAAVGALAGGSSNTPTAGTRPAGAAFSDGYRGTLAGAPLQRARCEQWLAATPSERLDAVRGIASTIGGPSTGGGVGTTLTEAEAVGLFNRTCATRDARGFVLYLIYARAASYRGVEVRPPATPGDL